MHAHALFLLIAVATLVLQGSILKDGYLEDVGDQYVFFSSQHDQQRARVWQTVGEKRLRVRLVKVRNLLGVSLGKTHFS